MSRPVFNPMQYTESDAKPMPILLILDNSGSMRGYKIDSLNRAVRNMIESLKQSARPDVFFTVAVFTFGTGIKLLHKFTNVASIHWRNIPISHYTTCSSMTGEWDDPNAKGTPLGRTLQIAKAFIENPNMLPERRFRPAVIFVTDGKPRDDWAASLRSFTGQGRSAHCDRWAMAIGQDADIEVIRQCVKGATNIDGTPRQVLFANDADTILGHFSYITTTIINTVVN